MMSLTFPPINNQTTVHITTANSNTLATLNSPSTITTAAIFSAPDMVSINLAPAIPISATGQDLNFETRLNAIENAIFKLGSILEKFISGNSPVCKSR